MRDGLLDLDDRHRRHHLDEAQEQDEEPGEAPDDDAAVDQRRDVVAEGVRVEPVREARHDDVEALEPHPDQHEDRHHVEGRQVRARPLPEEHQGRHAVAEDLEPPPRRVEPDPLVEVRGALHRLAAVPGGEALARVEVREHQPRDQDQLGHVVEVAVGDVRVQVEVVAHRDQEDEDHGESGEDRAVDEEGGEEGRVPARDQRHREVPGHHAVDRDAPAGSRAPRRGRRPAGSGATAGRSPASPSTAPRRSSASSRWRRPGGRRCPARAPR